MERKKEEEEEKKKKEKYSYRKKGSCGALVKCAFDESRKVFRSVELMDEACLRRRSYNNGGGGPARI